MGKRKERRLAAMNSTSRRVKLDLFAEPSGDLGGSDVRDGVEREKTEPNELPNSPSSSGHKTENPLLLLGQYSDDEVEEKSDRRADDATADISLAKKNEQVDELIQGHKDINIKSGADITMRMDDQQQTRLDSSALGFRAEGESGFVTVSNTTILDGLNKQVDPSLQASSSVSLEHHAPTDATSQWKMILHEESNQYYYWNTETGETSWEIPAVLSATASTYTTRYNGSGPTVTNESTMISGVESSYMLPMQNSIIVSGCSTVPTLELDERNKSDGHQVDCTMDSVVTCQPCQEDLARPGISDHVNTNFDTAAVTDLPSRLLSQSEALLEKLRSLKRSRGNFHSNEQISNYILEVEVRHSDVKALILDTSPLLSFWLHTEKQLKRLEDSVNDEIYQLAKSAVLDEIAETEKIPPKEKLIPDANTESESGDGRRGELTESGKSLHSDETADVSGNGSLKHSGSHPAEQSDIISSTEMLQKAGSPDVEDIDMDVDMEVEESVPVSSVQVIDASDGKMFSQTESSNLYTDVPPPPGEERIPPPPSESEDIPPPPPDGYSEPIPPPPYNGDVPPSLASDSLGVPYSVPQSYMQQSADYATQYNLSYPDSNYQYIPNAVALDPNTQFYGHVDGSQVSLPQSTFYYETVSGTSEVAPASATAGEAYYDFNGAAPLFPVITSAESLLQHSGVASANYNIPRNASTPVLPSLRSNDSTTDIASSGTASQSTDATGGSTLSTKGQTKVKRPKKRTVAATSTLRSNKKVSSLVDKWKAAKEELNDSEEEEEDDYVILERKRQREIEEWKSRQIASGEAKDNANFQPLGGDWREKVKRKREGTEKTNKKKKDEEKQEKPDVTKLSANLPSGWQAYWDESTKKVYYGNRITSQTSWTLPTT